MRSIYEYNDYSQYLKDFVQEYLAASSLNTMNSFAEMIGISPSTLSRILKGKRGISVDLAKKIAAAIGLKKRRADYFLLLVKMAKEKTSGGQSIIRIEVENLKKLNRRTIGPEQYLIFEKWYLLPLRELLRTSTFNVNTDCHAISRLFNPAVTESQIQKGIQMLVDLDMANIDSKGMVKSNDSVVSTGDYWDNLVIHKYQKEMASIAVDSIDVVDRKECDFSTLTLNLNRDGFLQAKKIIKECREKLLELEEVHETQHNDVFHLNVHLFPVCKRSGGLTE